MTRPWKDKPLSEIMSYLAQGPISAVVDLSLADSGLYRAMQELCCRVLEDEVGEIKIPEGRELRPSREELHAMVSQLLYRFGSASPSALAEHLLIAMHEWGALAPSYEPDGMPHRRSWPKED